MTRITLSLNDSVLGTAGAAGEASTAYFCPHCGRIWARLTRDKTPFWVSLTRPCSGHAQGWPGEVPGSFFTSYDWYGGAPGMRAALAANPALARYELGVHLRHFELRMKGMA